MALIHCSRLVHDQDLRYKHNVLNVHALLPKLIYDTILHTGCKIFFPKVMSDLFPVAQLHQKILKKIEINLMVDLYFV